MRAYVATTGLIFVLMVGAHVARLAVEGPGALRSPIFIVASLLSVGMLVWSIRVFRGLGRSLGAGSASTG